MTFAEGRRCAAIDIGNAYLEASIGSEEVFIELDSNVVAASKRLGKDLSGFADVRGKVVAKLRKVLYGCVQSAKLWYDRLCAKAVGFCY
jgi:hypothetical protein